MASEDLSVLLSEVLRDLQKPLNNWSAIHQVLKKGEDDLNESIQSIRHEMTELCEKMGFEDDMRDNKIYLNKLEQMQAEKKKEVDIQTATLQMTSEVKAETTKLKRDLQNRQQQSETRLRAQHKQLELAQATYSAYLSLCGHVRLDCQHTGPEVRGAVSRAPTTEVTFSLQPAELSSVRLSNRLWKIATEHAAQHGTEHGSGLVAEHATILAEEHDPEHGTEHDAGHSSDYDTKHAASSDSSADPASLQPSTGGEAEKTGGTTDQSTELSKALETIM